MINFFKKAVFLLQKPPVVLISGEEADSVGEAAFKVLSEFFKVRRIKKPSLPWVKNHRDIILFQFKTVKPNVLDGLKFFLRKSKRPVLVVSHLGDIPPDKYFFSGRRKDSFCLRKIAEILPGRSFCLLNFDDEVVREIENETAAQVITFGFQKRADLRVTDINLKLEGTNFKLNYEGYSIPFWLDRVFGKAHIYHALALAGLAIALDINTVDVSRKLKEFPALPGKMRLLEGVKKSQVIDDTASSSVYSMAESLNILKEAGRGRRKIAVLGDVIGVGKYTPEAHEALGERVASSADILFAVGYRASFIAQGARKKRMSSIYEFKTAKEAKRKVQEEMKKGDLVLIDGSKEMKMKDIAKEIVLEQGSNLW